MKKVHVTLQGKGGIGKSFVCFLLAQYITAKGHQVLCIDTDCVNGTFRGFEGLGVVGLDILEGTQIDRAKFDQLVDIIVGSNKDVVIDNGASVFLPLWQYMLENRLAETLAEAGRELVVHTVVVGGPAMEETLAGLLRMVKDFPEGTTFVVWENPFWGPVKRNNRLGLEHLVEYDKLRDRVAALLKLPTLSELFRHDLGHMLQERLTFEEARMSGRFWIQNLQRLVMIKRRLFVLMDGAL